MMYPFTFVSKPEYAGNLGDAGDTEWKEAEQQHILQLIDKFWYVFSILSKYIVIYIQYNKTY